MPGQASTSPAAHEPEGRACDQPHPGRPVGQRWMLEAVTVAAGAAVLAILLTYPLAFKIDRVGRVDSGDGQFSIWNVAWVAHSLVTRPDRLFDANIFYPHRNALAFSEANLVAGTLAVPAYWLTGNPYLAHNSVVLLGFVLSVIGTYLLVRYLAGHRGAAAVAAITYAFCPFVFARQAHIQLLLIFTLPFVLLALHVFIDRLSIPAMCALAAALAVAALSCGYYGIFAGLITALGLAWFGLSRGLWRRLRFWLLSAGAALLSLLAVAPFLRHYLWLGVGTENAFRSLAENVRYSADWLAYLTAGGWGDRWMMETWGRGNEVLFPGFVALGLGLAGMAVGLAACIRRFRAAAQAATAPASRAARSCCSCEIAGFYVVVGLLAFWLSFGPKGGLYTLFYHAAAFATLLRAPARAGIVVTLALSVLGGLALATFLQGRKGGGLISAAIACLAAVELAQVPLNLPDALPLHAAYQTLAYLPRGPVVEFPFFWRREDYHRHCFYLLNSTAHWLPLVNGYSDHIPDDFRRIVDPLSTFPSRGGFEVLKERRVLYAVFHLNFYDRRSKQRLFERLEQYKSHLRPLIRHGDVWLYEIMSFP